MSAPPLFPPSLPLLPTMVWCGPVRQLSSVLIVDTGSGTCLCGFAGFPRVVFLYVVVRPLMLRIKAGFFQKDSDAGLVLLVILSALCFLLLSSDPDARHLGRSGPEGQVCSTRVLPRSSSNATVAYLAGFAGDDFYAVFPSVVVGRTGMIGICVGVDQKDLYAFSTVCNDRCHGLWGAENCGISAVAVHAGRRHFLRCAEADFHGPSDQGDSPVTRGYGDRWPCLCSRAVPCRDAEACPMVHTVCWTTGALFCRACWSSTSQSWCRGRFPCGSVRFLAVDAPVVRVVRVLTAVVSVTA